MLVSTVAVGLAAPPLAGPAHGSSADFLEPRAAAGLSPLVRHSGLETAAARHAQAMAASGVLSHMSEALATSFITESLATVAQNVGVGASVEEVESKMMTSAQHRANILGDFDLVGTAQASGGDGRVWISQVFAKLGAVPVAAPVPAAVAAAAPPPAPAAMATTAAEPVRRLPPVAAPARGVVAGPVAGPIDAPPPVATGRRRPIFRSTLWWRAAFRAWRLAPRA